MASIEIQGINCIYRDPFEGEEILYSDLPQDEQFFRLVSVPFNDDELVAIANKELQYTAAQKSWVDREKLRMTYGNGVYASINAKLKYIPASYWGYLNYWTLENGKKPEYREADRRFFLFKEYICFETGVLGITRGKGRRKGATSQGTYWEWWICGRNEEKNGGMISYNDTSGGDIFQKMFMRGFKDMLPCFVEDFDSDSENFIRFVKPVEKKKKGVPIKREGLRSYVDHRSTAINSYDSGRLSYGLFDESGKYEKMDINTYWSKVSPCLKEGKHKVGFAYLPTTVNPKKKGGENYEKFWKLCNQNAINPATKEPYGLNTPNKVVRYLDPATEGYAGCIDKFGESVIFDPEVPIMGNDGDWITEGSITIIKRERALLEGEQLMEHRRDYPLDEFDMFAFATGSCEFNEKNMVNQLTELELNPRYLRKVRFFEEKTETKAIIPGTKDRVKREVKWMDDEKGDWLLYEEPKDKNKFSDHNGVIVPQNTLLYCVGVDTFRIGFAEEGSKGTICVFKKSNVLNGQETGNYPVAMYIGRPRLIQHLYDEVLKICLFYGCKVNFEISAGDFFYGYFHDRDAIDLLYWTPALDPNKPNPKLKPGTESASPFELAAQLECAKVYYDGNDNSVYNGNVHRVVFPELLKQSLAYNHSERTPYDLVISLMMALLPAMKVPAHHIPPPLKPKSLLPTFKITKYANQ